MNELEHDWFNQQVATYLAGGLNEEERERFEAHARECEACAHELDEARGVEEHLAEVFAPVIPAADFEDRVVGRFQAARPRRRMNIHPMVRKAALAAAAAVVVGGIGLVSEQVIRDGKLVSPEQIAGNLRAITLGIERYSSDHSAIPTTQPDGQQPVADASGPNQAASESPVARRERARTISDLISESNELVQSGKYNQAVAVLDQVLTLDPNNEYARNTRPLLEDRALLANQRLSRERFDRSVVRQFNQAEEPKIPYSDILRFADEWPDLREQGDRTAQSPAGWVLPRTTFTGGGTIYGSVSHESGTTNRNLTVSNGITNLGSGTSSLVYSGSRTATVNGGVGFGGDRYVSGGATATAGGSSGRFEVGAGPLNLGNGTNGFGGLIVNGGATPNYGIVKPAGGDELVIWSGGTGANQFTSSMNLTGDLTTGGSSSLGISGSNGYGLTAGRLAVRDGGGSTTFFREGAVTFYDSDVVKRGGGVMTANGGTLVLGGGLPAHNVPGVTMGGGTLTTGPVPRFVNTGAGTVDLRELAQNIHTDSNVSLGGALRLNGVSSAGAGTVPTDARDNQQRVAQGQQNQQQGQVANRPVNADGRLRRAAEQSEPRLGATAGESNRAWTFNGDQTWSINANWLSGSIQTGGGQPVFPVDGAGGAPKTTNGVLPDYLVRPETARGIASLSTSTAGFGINFKPDQYTIAGTGTLTLDSGVVAPITVTQGNSSGNASVRELRNLGMQVPSGSLSFGETIANANNSGMQRLGGGTASFTRLNMPGGTVYVGAGSASMTAKPGGIQFTGGTTLNSGVTVNGGTARTAPAALTPVIGEGGAPTKIVQGFIQQPMGPNPSAAIERTEQALAMANTLNLNTEQQPAPAQPSPGGAAAGAQGQAPPQVQQPQPAPAIQIRRVIRDGVMEFEVDSFDSTFAVVSKITIEEGGFIVAADSDRLQNGKVRGTITVRVPPDNLDTLILKLRALGELKSQKLGSKDISKEYTDLESELRAGRAMEERLLEMIKNAQGEVKDLLEAEKELATWRIRLEKIQGQMNYYNNLVSMATLTINAYEKDIRTPATATQSEEINAGIEAEDVDGARTSVIQAIGEVQGRIVESTMQQMNAGQFAARIVADVSQENAGQVVDRLRQIGRLARLDSQRKQTTGTGQTTPAPSVQPRVEQAPTRLVISIYNLANVAPRLTTNLNFAADDVEAIYRQILARVDQAGGRVVSSNLNRQDATQITGTIQFEVKTPDAEAVLNDIRQPVQTLRMNVTENPDTANVTSTKQGFTVQIIPTAQVTPRLTTNLNLAAENVEVTYASILNQVRTLGGRVIASNLNRQDATQAIGSIQFEVKSTDADALMNELRQTVQVLTLNVSENTGAANLTSLKQGFSMQIIPAAQVQPREVRALAVQTSAVDSAVQNVTAAVNGAGGRVLESSMTQDEGGAMIARIALEVPLDKLDTVTDVAKAQGKVRTAEAQRNTQVPEGPLSRARINLTVGTGETIVPATGGFWETIRGGLSTSVKGLLWSLQLIIIGLCLVGPWVLLVWGGVRWIKRRKPPTAPVTTV